MAMVATKRVLEYLRDREESVITPRKMSEDLGMKHNNAATILQKMAADPDNQVQRVGRGQYMWLPSDKAREETPDARAESNGSDDRGRYTSISLSGGVMLGVGTIIRVTAEDGERILLVDSQTGEVYRMTRLSW